MLPGALVATALWWIADITFGFYVRRVPYNVVYGGLAAVIGLLIWMQISAVIVFLGAAWNAESAEMKRRQAHEMPDRVEKQVQVETYSGYKADERPVRVKIDGATLEVAEVEDRWYSPGATFFRVRLANGERYVLRRIEAQEVWVLEAYRSAGRATSY